MIKEFHDTNAGALPVGVPTHPLFIRFNFKRGAAGQRVLNVVDTGARMMVTTDDSRFGVVTRELSKSESVRWWFTDHRP